MFKYILKLIVVLVAALFIYLSLFCDQTDIFYFTLLYMFILVQYKYQILITLYGTVVFSCIFFIYVILNKLFNKKAMP